MRISQYIEVKKVTYSNAYSLFLAFWTNEHLHEHTHTHTHKCILSHTRTYTHTHKHTQTQANINKCIHNYMPKKQLKILRAEHSTKGNAYAYNVKMNNLGFHFVL